MTKTGFAADPERPIAVIGAGIIGVSIAYELQRRGLPVVLVDRADAGSGASFGNLACIAVTEFLPASRPSIWAQLPGWALDPQGPIRLRPSYLPRLAPWLIRFLAASRPSRVRAIEAAGAALCERVYDDLLPLLADAGLSDMLSDEGCLCLYRDEAEMKADREHIAALERYGVEHRVLDGKALRDLEPALSPEIGMGVLFPHNRSIRNPHELVCALFKLFMDRGGRFVSAEVGGFARNPGGAPTIQLRDGRTLDAAGVVLCAGAYTGRLARLLGEHIPLETERGYHTQVMAPGIGMRHSIIWPAKAFMVTPTAGGLRIGGTVEMAGLDAPPDFRRAKVLVKRAQEALPGLVPNETSEWMGHRPALPDTVPVIGPSAKAPGVWYATGHGHLGLTLAATTARLLGDMMTGGTPPIDMSPYRVDRF
jgi:D-amino-acid dehydrogenase